MDTKYNLTVTLTPDDVARIISEHVNKELGSGFKSQPANVTFNLTTNTMEMTEQEVTELTSITIDATHISARSRQIR